MLPPALDLPLTTRFAPSPTGLLHLGHAFAALTAFDLAQRQGGRFLLRIEDIDGTRCREDFVAAILDDLAWLSLSWDEPVWRQSHRMAHYAAALAQLETEGLTYPCFCTRKDIAAALTAPQGPTVPLYPGTCKAVSLAERTWRIAALRPYVVRLDTAKAVRRLSAPLRFLEEGRGPDGESGLITADPTAHGDIVLARREFPASYHLCVVLDDAAQGVTLVSRGDDLFGATAIQRLLQALLRLPEPRYHHHRLIRDETGRRLAKRDQDKTLRSLRNNGVSPADIRRVLDLGVAD